MNDNHTFWGAGCSFLRACRVKDPIPWLADPWMRYHSVSVEKRIVPTK
jgi:hypothetical protein